MDKLPIIGGFIILMVAMGAGVLLYESGSVWSDQGRVSSIHNTKSFNQAQFGGYWIVSYHVDVNTTSHGILHLSNDNTEGANPSSQQYNNFDNPLSGLRVDDLVGVSQKVDGYYQVVSDP